jgi:hypothetical protein
MHLTRLISPEEREFAAPARVYDSASSSAEMSPEWATTSIQVATDREAVNALRPYWEPATNGLDTDIDYYLQNFKNDWTILRPYVISIFRGKDKPSMLLGYTRSRKATTRISMVRVSGPRARVLEIVPNGLLGPATPEITKLMVNQLAQTLQGEVDLLCFRRLALDGQLFSEVSQIPGLLVRVRIPHTFSYSTVTLAESKEVPAGKRFTLFSGKMRREARRKTSNLQKAFPGGVAFRSFSDSSELNAGLADMERVSTAAWQHSLGVGFTDILPSLEAYQAFARKGWLRIFVLYVSGQPCAYLLGQLHKGTFYCQRTGYHPNFARYSVGSVLTAMAFENLAAAGARQVNLGEGDQEHHRRLGCEKNEEGTVHVYAPTFRGIGLNLFFGITQALREAGRRAQEGLRLDRSNKRWRQYWLSKWQSSEPPTLEAGAEALD